MNHQDFRAAREFLERKSVGLMEHEKKGDAPVGWPPQNFEEFAFNGRTFYIVRTNVFREVIGSMKKGKIIDGVLAEASHVQSALFGTSNASNVIEAIYNVLPWGSLPDFHEFLRHENFCYLIENVNGVIDEKVLRLDLFRDIKQNTKGGVDFVGGIFHAYKHFSCKGKPLSTSQQIHDIPSPDYLVRYIANSFFHGDLIQENDSDYIVEVPYNEKYGIVFVFYREVNTDVYFLRTVRQGKPRTTK